MNQITYDCRWSDEVDAKFIKDFVDMQNAVFEEEYTQTLFQKKYINTTAQYIKNM
jgi:hypothetical protein